MPSFPFSVSLPSVHHNYKAATVSLLHTIFMQVKEMAPVRSEGQDENEK